MKIRMKVWDRIGAVNISLGSVDKSNYYYVIVNIGLSVFSFLRSFVFMRVLDLRELGLISLVQTIFMFVGLLQMGLLNGGYRIVSLGKNDDFEKTNNTIYSYLLILLPIGIVFCICSALFDWISDMSFTLLVISVVFGIFTLLNNWFHNILIGEQKLSEVNRVNIVSYALSALMLPFAYWLGFTGGMLVIVVQPLAFVIMSLIRNKELMPTGFMFKWEYIHYILRFGFIPFLGGIFVALYTQIERWSVNEVLGVEALGKFYLVFLYVSLYLLVPNSINSIFFPKGVKAYSSKQYKEFKRIILYYYAVLVGYGFFIAITTILFLKPIVSVVFPNHLQGVSFVYYVLPGLILSSLTHPIALILNSSVILRPMLIVNIVNLIFKIVVIAVMISLAIFSLENVAHLRTASGVVFFVGYIITYIIIKRRLYK